MKTSRMENLDLSVSRLGFGCMRFPTLQNGKIDREKSVPMLEYAYEHGVTYYDTAYVYHNQESESFVGDVMSRYPRESYMLATKLPLWECRTVEDVDRIFNEQLSRLKTDYIDFYLIHSLDDRRWPQCKELKVYEYLEQKKAEGIIKYLGFSFHGHYEDFEEIVDEKPWDFVQIQINYMDYEVQNAKAYYDKLLQKGLPCICMEPVRGGFLARLSDEVGGELTQYDSSMSYAAWAFRWCISQENIKVILSGMSTMEQVVENVELFSAGEPLNDEQIKVTDRVRAKILKSKTVPCTGCRYCMDCSFGVDIPGVFSVYNQYMLFKNNIQGYNQYAALGEGNGGACMSCGACSPQCPQGIDIPAELEKAHKKLSSL